MSFPLSRLTLACLAAISVPAYAADLQLDDSVVTARGYASDSFDTPQAINVIKPQATSQGPAGNLLRGQPGMALQSDGAWGQNPVLRGLKRESVVVMVDGFRVNSAQPQGALASFLDLGLLDRVEVVKGPGSVMHGSGAMGGVVNLLTPEPRFTDQAELGGRFGASASSVDHGYSGALLLQGSNAEQGFVVGIAGRDVGNYKSPNGREKKTGYESDTLLLKYQHKIADDYVLRANVQHHNDDDVWYPGSARTAGKPGGEGLPPPLGKVTIHSPKQQREMYALGLDAPLLGGTLSTDVYRQEVYREIRAYSKNLNRDWVRNDVSFITHGLRSQWNGALTDSHWLTVGVDGWKMTGDPERYMDNNAPLFNNNMRNDPFKDGEVTSLGVFVQDEFSIGSTLMTAGLRYDRTKGDAKVKGTGPAAQTTGLSNSSNNLSWSLGAVQPLTDTLNLYANVGQAYRAPDMRERFEDSARGDSYYHIGNPQLDSERSSSVELGLKGRDGLQAFQLAAFYTRIDDYIAGRVTGKKHVNGMDIKRTENLDKVVIYGLEGNLEVPLSVFVVDAGFTWMRGKNKQDNEPLYQMPANELRLGIGQPAERGFSWHTGLRAVAKQDRIAKKFSNGSEDKTDSFITADARVGYGFGALAGLKSSHVDLQLSNLTNEKYHEHLTDGLSGQELKAAGRGVTLAFSGAF
ncbi:TonB-dependent receptor [Pseudomonas sp. C27(2019)]|uniref:TonB-dependent receptor plug domain-containing protein n=1 Tax=Pseudomonas sp. C27(2019) TaxID=2604941 RepID=UPI001244833F|nr:TonB-dependent receptor [Pseudomonas sp. C27(2019)]QEY58574.1 TonB-dependent receptor [Pseudomonas sp. C27(2019)]